MYCKRVYAHIEYKLSFGAFSRNGGKRGDENMCHDSVAKRQDSIVYHDQSDDAK